MIYRAERDQVLEAARRCVTQGLTHGTSGNVSLRLATGFAVTPSGLDYAEAGREDIVVLDDSGIPLAGERRVPSSEWPMHARIYQTRVEVRAIVHGHSPAATALACLGRDVPPIHYMIAIAGGDSIRCAPYRPFGTDDLARVAVEALTDRKACLLAHHGFLAVGESLQEALSVAAETEFLADLYLRLLPLGDPPLLSREAIADALARFAGYGQPRHLPSS
ncbi:MAG: class II aldolase/adducin family protein [Gemmatimonadales bacterium]|nr:class II aldolase/adducin family protein [Gemmatimonadales bacterium]